MYEAYSSYYTVIKNKIKNHCILLYINYAYSCIGIDEQKIVVISLVT
jgi:hypothetical protein